ncbi:MAG: DUF4091 domain-containing protein, partial [Saprospiraceae bacterium]|nr:DUF4091 domain-containing protein [Saprospiraceae bacterium]
QYVSSVATKGFSRATEVIVVTLGIVVFSGCINPSTTEAGWDVTVLPSSVRLDPSSGKILENRPDLYKMESMGNLLEKNWIYDGSQVDLYCARGEYVSFQLVIEKTGSIDLKDIIVKCSPFKQSGKRLTADPELFLEWAVRVTSHSTGYEKTSLGPGYYPDALIPLKFVEMDIDQYPGRIRYPFELPDFINRIENQRYALVWVDQWVPIDREKATPGDYLADVTVSVEGEKKTIPVKLHIWDFALPNQNTLAGNLQQEGFLKGMDETRELQLYQLLKRHRVVPADPTYDPSIKVSQNGEIEIDFAIYDNRLKKYFTGEAFTEEYGYKYGPGYGEPIEQFVLPFDVYGKHGGGGWPDIVKQELTPSADWLDMYKEATALERLPEKEDIYLEAIHLVREHILDLVDPAKTDLIVYLNGLDESYFPEAWDRMKYWGGVYKRHFPETKFRVDGAYSTEAMEVIKDILDYWCCHTIGYDIETIKQYRALGVTDWLYGPQMYEREQNGWCGSSTFMDLELSNERLISWSCFKYESHTWCSWGMGSGWTTGWYNSETFKDLFRDHGTGPLSYRRYNGNAMEVYAPGFVAGIDEPCPSLRLKNMRDGVEEYEYMQLLTKLDGNRDRVDKIVNSIVFDPYGKAAIGNLNPWNHNPNKWDEARILMGQLIEGAVPSF